MNIIVYLKNGMCVEIPNATYSFRKNTQLVNQPILVIYNRNTNMEIGIFMQDEVAGIVKGGI